MFVEVVERASFSRAAIALQMSAAKVSTQISNLERYLGVQLLSRTTRACAMTEEGEAYYAHCKHVLAEIAETEALFNHTRKAPQGRLRVDASVTFINRLLLPVLGEFRERFPAIELELIHTEHVFDVKQEGLDVMFRMGPLHDSGVIARQLGVTNMVTAASPSYLKRCGEPQTPHDLMHHQCINYLDSHTGRSLPWEFEDEGGRIIIRPSGGLAFNQGESRLAAAVQGLGIYRGLELNLEHLLQQGALKLILNNWVTPSPPIYVAYARHKHLSSKVRAFVDYIAECYPPGQSIQIPHCDLADPVQLRA